MVEGDVRRHSEVLTALIQGQRDAERREATRTEREVHLDERLDRIEKAIGDGATASADAIKALATEMNGRFNTNNRWKNIAIGASITTLIGAIWMFIIRGGLNNIPLP